MKRKFVELARCQVQDKRVAVISENKIDGGFTLGQQVTIEENTLEINLFLKGAIHISTVEGLYNLRDALNKAIEVYESEVQK